MKYGIISDIHGDPRIIIPAIEALKANGAEKLVLNGDLQQKQGNLEETQQFLALVLLATGKSGLDTYVQPGSHECLPGFDPVVEHFANKFDNIYTVSRISSVDCEDHRIVFLPGSDVTADIGEFVFGTDLLTGEYIKTPEGVITKDEARLLPDLSSRFRGFLSYHNIHDLRDHVKDADNTIVFCHVPRRFDNLEDAVDVDEYGLAREDFYTDITRYKDGDVQIGSIIQPRPIEKVERNRKFGKDSRFSKDTANLFMRSGCPIDIVSRNVGNEKLKALYEELGIKKAVSGHIHGSGHRANDCSGRHVNEDELVDELFWNSGCLSNGQTGILSTEGKKVSYHNIKLEL